MDYLIQLLWMLIYQIDGLTRNQSNHHHQHKYITTHKFTRACIPWNRSVFAICAMVVIIPMPVRPVAAYLHIYWWDELTAKPDTFKPTTTMQGIYLLSITSNRVFTTDIGQHTPTATALVQQTYKRQKQSVHTRDYYYCYALVNCK